MVQPRVEGAEVLERPASGLLVRRAGLTFGWESMRDILGDPELPGLLYDNWWEIEEPTGAPNLAPDFARLVQLEDQGLFRVWAARDGDTLVGYIAFFVQPHLHYRHTLYAVEDAMLLRESHRKGLRGYLMIASAMDALRVLGVKRCYCNEPPSSGIGKIYRRLGFSHAGNIWVRTL